MDAGGGGGAGVEALLGACCVPCLGDYAERLVEDELLVVRILLGGSSWSCYHCDAGLYDEAVVGVEVVWSPDSIKVGRQKSQACPFRAFLCIEGGDVVFVRRR